MILENNAVQQLKKKNAILGIVPLMVFGVHGVAGHNAQGLAVISKYTKLV